MITNEDFDIIPETAPEAFLVSAGKALTKERDDLKKELRDLYAQVEANDVDRIKMAAEIGETKRKLAIFTEGLPSYEKLEMIANWCGEVRFNDECHWLQRLANRDERISSLNEVLHD